MQAGCYVVTNVDSMTKWIETGTRSLKGAKMIASRLCKRGPADQIRVGYTVDETTVQIIATKRGAGKWRDL